nr:hypothetical protein [Tanacetum cinerariifolium]
MLNGITPYELVFGKEPNINHLRSFGCLCFAMILNNNDKFSKKSEKCVFVGYSNFKKGYKLYSLKNKTLFYSKDVKFYENIFPLKLTKTNDTSPENSSNTNLLNFFDTPYFPNPNPTDTLPNDDAETESEDNDGESSVSGSISNSMSESLDNDATTDDIAHSSTDDNRVEPGSISEGNHKILNIQSEPITQRRSERASKLPTKLSEYVLDEKVKYGIQRHVKYSHLSKENYCFSTNLNKTLEPSSYYEACTNKDWVSAMNTKMEALNRNDTWVITDLPLNKKPIGCKWIYKIKYKSNGDIERYKARLVAKGYNQREGVDHDETFSPVVKIVTIRCLISMAVNQDQGICLSQRKYCMELLAKYGLLTCKPASTPIESKLVIIDDPINKKDKPLKNITEYQKPLGKLIYLTHTRPDISYVVHSLSQFMHSPLTSHLKLALRFLKYLKNAPEKGIHICKTNSLVLMGYVDSDWAKCKATRRFVTGFSVFFGKSLVSWKSKKQIVVARSSAEAEYRALATVTCEIMWLLNLLRDFKLEIEKPVLIFCDNKAALQIAVNPVFHDKTKHFEIDLHFVRDKINESIIKPSKIESANNLADVFTKGLSVDQLTHLLEGLNMFDPFKT